tara:strand:- start:1954 stop:2499 length:546 start_codon:yes stop_codon:yes gene_type:complete
MLTRTIVIAIDQNTGGIGNNGNLLYSIPKDIRHFAKTTMEIPTCQIIYKRNLVVMGRKTWDSIPLSKKPLKNRMNIVFTSRKIDHPDVYSVASMDEYKKVECSLSYYVNKIFIIGGQQIYNMFLEHGLVQECVCTHIISTQPAMFDTTFDLKYLNAFKCEEVIEQWSENDDISCKIVRYSN